MENPGKLIRIFFIFYYHCYHYHSVLFLYLSLLLLLFYYYFFFIYRSKLRIDSLLHLLCPEHPRERNDRSVVILASEIYL